MLEIKEQIEILKSIRQELILISEDESVEYYKPYICVMIVRETMKKHPELNLTGGELPETIIPLFNFENVSRICKDMKLRLPKQPDLFENDALGWWDNSDTKIRYTVVGKIISQLEKE